MELILIQTITMIIDVKKKQELIILGESEKKEG